MQCFGGCFAPDKDPHVSATVSGAGPQAGADAWVSKTSSKVADHQSPFALSNDSTAQPASGSGRTSFRAKLRSLSSKSSKQLSVPEVTYTSNHDSSAADRERLRQDYLMEHGRHILGVSTLQQEQLHHFVMPGEALSCICLPC